LPGVRAASANVADCPPARGKLYQSSLSAGSSEPSTAPRAAVRANPDKSAGGATSLCSSYPKTPSSAAKNSSSPRTVRWLGDELPAGLISAASETPVPSYRQSSPPWIPSSASKYRVPSNTSRCKAQDSPAPGLMSATIDTSVPS